jgi:hypothetical protein
MLYQEFNENWKTFSDLIDKLPTNEDEKTNALLHHYIEQNIILLNDVFSISIAHLKKLQKAKTANDIICTQARFTNEISKNLSLSTQRFLNSSLGQIADYNEWLKEHCDFATD